MLSSALGMAISTLGAVEQERAALLASIEGPKAILAERRERAMGAIESALLDIMSERGLEILADPESAAEVYSIGWLNGWGLEGFDAMLDLAVDHPSVLFSLGDWSGDGTWNSGGMVKQASVRFQRGGDPALVDSAIAVLGPILEAQWAIDPGASLQVCTDAAVWGTVHIRRGDGGSVALMRNGFTLAQGPLDVMVRLVAQEFPSGATKAYQLTHHGDNYQPPVYVEDGCWNCP